MALHSYVSSFCSDYHKMFVGLGYPMLDIVRYTDGSWAIIEMLNSPVVPSLTKWQVALADIRHQEINEAFLKHMLPKIDLHGREFWAREDGKTRAMLAEKDAVDRHIEEHASLGAAAITKNPALMERFAENGITEINLPKIARNISPKKLGLSLRSHFDVGRLSMPAGEDFSARAPQPSDQKAGADLRRDDAVSHPGPA